MANATFVTAPNSNTVALFRAWGQAISQALASVGMVKTADTGQINWAQAALPAAGGSSGYEIWRFDDALQSVAPIFFKLEYGAGAVVATPQLYLTVGKDSSGAGEIVTQLVARVAVGRPTSGNISTVAVDGFVSTCATNACVCVMPFSGESGTLPAAPPGFIIERSRNLKGEATRFGVMVAIQGDQPNPQTSSPPASMYACNYENSSYNFGSIPVMVPYWINSALAIGVSSISHGVISPIVPWIVYAPGLTPWQSVAAASYVQGDFNAGIFDSTVGPWTGKRRALSVVTRPYWGLSVRGGAQGAGLVVQGRVGLMIVWEG